MCKKISLPIFVLETETGDITLYHDTDDLRRMVEEFWDILTEDFKFWDKDGYPIKFEKSFLNKNDFGMIRGDQNEYQIVKSCLLKYAEKNGVSITNSGSEGLVALYNLIVKRKAQM